MINKFEVIETNKMIENYNLDVRTITLGISLLDCISDDLDTLNNNIYNKIKRLAGNLVQTGEDISKEYGIPIVNKRISVTPIALVGQSACKTPEDFVTIAKTLDKVAKEVGVNNGEVALAYGLSFADGLSIASIAAKKQMPILLTRDTSMPNATKNFIANNNINKTYVVGSTTVISEAVLSQTKKPKRLGGKNRYETNSLIFNEFKSEINLSAVYVASGLSFPDALSSSAIAAKYGNFVLLSNTKQVEGTVKNVISNIKSDLNIVYVLGSDVVISDKILLGLDIDSIK